jgi:hypothetical protein
MEVELASYAAIGACGSNQPFLLFGPVPGIKILLGHQSPNRACLNAFPAEDAIGVLQCPIRLGHDLRPLTPVPVTDGVVHLDLVAGLDAPPAENASGKIPYNERIHILHKVLRLVGGKPVSPDLITNGQILKPAFAVNRAEVRMLLALHGLELKVRPGVHVQVLSQAVVMAGGKQEFQIEPPRRHHFGRLAPDHHLRRRRCGAGGEQSPRALHLYQADAAGPGGSGGFHMAKGRDVYAVASCNVKDGFTWRKGKFVPVYDHCALRFHEIDLG